MTSLFKYSPQRPVKLCSRFSTIQGTFSYIKINILGFVYFGLVNSWWNKFGEIKNEDSETRITTTLYELFWLMVSKLVCFFMWWVCTLACCGVRQREEGTLKILLLWRDEVICQTLMAGQQNSFLFPKQDATITNTHN